MRLVIIGGGNMGGAILLALSRAKRILPKDILLIEKDEEKRKYLSKEVGCPSKAKIEKVISNYDLLIIAVKPQVSNSVMKLLAKWILPEQLIISVMAGVSIRTIADTIMQRKIVRVMPNIPTLISKGVIVFFPSKEISKKEIKWIKTIFSSCGTCIKAKNEDEIDVATAISGSGPGYIYYFAEEITSSAISLGFSEKDAKKLVQKTFLGTVLLWQKMAVSPDILRKQVSSPGGTTITALNHFKSEKIDQSIKDGIQKAYFRAKELSS